MKVQLEKEYKVIILSYVLSYLVLYIVMLGTSYFLAFKYYEKLAYNTTALATNSILSNDKRQMLFYLNSATLNFKAVSFIEQNGTVEFKLPTSFNPKDSSLFLVNLNNPIMMGDVGVEPSVAIINYYYDYFKIFLTVTGCWILLILFSIPLFLLSKRSLEKKYKESLLVNQLKFTTELSQQVAHDIRSPLTALNMVMGSTKELPEDKRILIRNAVHRINDIANNLLEKRKSSLSESETNSRIAISTLTETQSKVGILNALSKSIQSTNRMDVHLLSTLIDMIVSEKRTQYRNKINVHIEADLDEAYGLFARLDAYEFQRVLSNLINNSVESFVLDKGEVKISVRGYTDKVVVVILDNGKGIPEPILTQLGTKGITYGKEGSDSGHGLGIVHAKNVIESMGGQFEIRSRLGEGTMVNLTLPRMIAPNWFVEKINLKSSFQLVSVDDDISIHQIWSGRLKSLRISDCVQHISFTSTVNFVGWMQNQKLNKNYEISNFLFLIDFEFLNESVNGLELIESLKIANQSILISSRYEESKIRDKCNRLGLRLIPKSMAGLVPITVDDQKEIQDKTKEIICDFDAILIDDDSLVHMSWNLFAVENNKKYKTFYTVTDFLKVKADYEQTTPIYIDSNLADNIKGEEVSKEIYSAGFKNIFIATGYEASSIPNYPWIKGVVGKIPQ